MYMYMKTCKQIVPIISLCISRESLTRFCIVSTEEPRNSPFQGTCGFYVLL